MIDYIFVIGSAVLGLATSVAILMAKFSAPPSAPQREPSAPVPRFAFLAVVFRGALRALEALAGDRAA